jgi:excisionase family DNA binding protein
MEDTTDRPWLTAPEIIAAFGCDKHTVYDAIARGELAAVRLGTTAAIRVHRDALAAWLRPAAKASA